MSESAQRVFVTGLGVISPLGLDVQSTWKGIVAGNSGIDFITAFDTEGFDTTFAAEVRGFEPEAYLERKESGAWPFASSLPWLPGSMPAMPE